MTKIYELKYTIPWRHLRSYNRLVNRTLDGDGPAPASVSSYLHDGNQIVLEFDGSEAADLAHRYLWGPAVDQILADEQLTNPGTPGGVLWPLADNLGTVRDLAAYDSQTDTTTVANHRVYDAFGALQSETNPAVDHLFAYTARLFDDATGLQWNLHRWYDPAAGRWLSRDPIGFEAGDANLYRYVANRALNGTDPAGLAATSDSADPNNAMEQYRYPATPAPIVPFPFLPPKIENELGIPTLAGTVEWYKWQDYWAPEEPHPATITFVLFLALVEGAAVGYGGAAIGASLVHLIPMVDDFADDLAPAPPGSTALPPEAPVTPPGRPSSTQWNPVTPPSNLDDIYPLEPPTEFPRPFVPDPAGIDVPPPPPPPSGFPRPFNPNS